MGMCTNRFTPDDSAGFIGWDPDTPGTGALTVLGVVPDDVVAARVTIHGIDRDALVQDNGFFYELSDAADGCEPVDSVTIFLPGRKLGHDPGRHDWLGVDEARERPSATG